MNDLVPYINLVIGIAGGLILWFVKQDLKDIKDRIFRVESKFMGDGD